MGDKGIFFIYSELSYGSICMANKENCASPRKIYIFTVFAIHKVRSENDRPSKFGSSNNEHREGPCKRSECQILYKGESQLEKNWAQDVLLPSQSQEFFIPKSEKTEELNINYFKENQTTIVVQSKYSDILTQNHTNYEVIDVTSFVKQFEAVASAYREDLLEKNARILINDI